MKALTIQQPWAGLIACGAKRIENRTWKTNYRGPLAIHAGAKRHPRGGAEQTQFAELLDRHPGAMSLGKIVAVAELVDVVRVDDLFLHPDLAGNQFAEGPFCWILSDVVCLPEARMPRVMGLLGLWNLSEVDSESVLEAVAQVRSQLAPVTA